MQSAYTVLFCHLWPLRLYHIFHIISSGTIFGKKRLFNVKCVFLFFLQLVSETCLILGIIQQDIIINVKMFSCKLVWIFSTDFSEKKKKRLRYQIYWKSGRWEPNCCMRRDGRTDVMKLTVAFLNSANAPKIAFICKWIKKRCGV